MKNKLFWVVKVIDDDGSRHYFGKDENVICDPWSSELMEFVEEFGFNKPEEALTNPYAYTLGGRAVTAEIIPLEVF